MNLTDEQKSELLKCKDCNINNFTLMYMTLIHVEQFFT